MQQSESNPTQGLGIAGLILGILSMILGIIPCTFFIGIVLSVIGIILSIIGLNKASRLRVDKGLLIAALVTSIIGFLISGLWGLFFKQIFTPLNDDFEQYDEQYEEFFQEKNTVSNTVDFDSVVQENEKTMDELEKYMNEIEKQDAALKDDKH